MEESMKTELDFETLYLCFSPDNMLCPRDRHALFESGTHRFFRKLLELQCFQHKDEYASSPLTISLIRGLMKLVFILEPLIPFFAAYFLNRQLKSWEGKDLIINHKVKITRLGRFYYRIDMRFLVTPQKVGNIINELAKNVVTKRLLKTSNVKD